MQVAKETSKILAAVPPHPIGIFTKLPIRNGESDEYGAALSRSQGGNTSSTTDPLKVYKLPADPWHIKIRWTTDS